jgi:hypothetical protein
MARKVLEMESPYRETFTGVLAFSTFAETEATIRTLENLYQKYHSASDKKGVDYCRQIASLGRRRAELISRNHKVSLRKRLQKQEMANWFRIWLETPSLFEDWLLMRKSTEEFQKLLER